MVTATTTILTSMPLPQTERTTSACALKKKQSTFKVGGGDGEVTEGETIRQRMMDDDND